MAIINFKIIYPDPMANVVETNLHQLRRDLEGRGLKVDLQVFESEAELEAFLLNQASGPEQAYEEVSSELDA